MTSESETSSSQRSIPLGGESNSSRIANWSFWLAVVSLFSFGIWLRTPTFTDLWVGVHNAWGGAFYSNVARNFIRYGLDTALAPVISTGIVDPSQFEFYYHHPPLTMWLTSLSFLVFGVHEWSARLVPLTFAILTMVLVFDFARTAYGRGPALCALVVMTVLPIDAYYSMHLDPNSSVSIFFTALSVDGYRRWLSSGKRRHYAVMLAAIILGCMTGWFTYLVVPGIVAHGWLIHRPEARGEMFKRLWILPAACVGVFILFMIHRQIAMSGGRPEAYNALGERLLIRSVNFAEAGYDRVAIMVQYLRRIAWRYTYPVVALSAGWLAYFLHRLWKRRVQAADWCIFILWTYGLLYAFAFPGHLISHDFFVRTYAPGVALASGILIWRVGSLVKHPVGRGVVMGVVLAVVSFYGIRETRYLFSRDNAANGPLLQGFGEVVAEVSTPRDPVFIPVMDRILQYYVDRPMTFVETPEQLEEAVAEVQGQYLVLVPERSADEFPDFLSYLRDTYPEEHESGLYMFRGGESSGER